jgi:hypothetical protein
MMMQAGGKFVVGRRSGWLATAGSFAALAAVCWLIAAGADAAPGKAGADAQSAPGGEQRYVVVLDESADRPGVMAKRHAAHRGAELERVFTKAFDGYSAKLTSAEAKAIAREPGVAAVGLDPKGEPAAQTLSLGARRIFAADSDCTPSSPINTNLDVDCLDDLRVDVDVAVLDTGIDPDHPDLNVVERIDCFGYDPTPEDSSPGDHTGCVTDTNAVPTNPECVGSHGTGVAGVIGAIDNGVGVAGIAPGARLWSVRVADEDVRSPSHCTWDPKPFYMSDVIAGVEWITTHADDIEVANMSMLFDVPDTQAGQALDTALEQAIESSIDAGVVYVAAAGNESANIAGYSPAQYPALITASGLADFDGLPNATGTTYPCGSGQQDDTLGTFSNYGASIDITAPACAPTTLPGGNYSTPGPGGAGTSISTAHVAGAAALLASTDNPNNATDVADIRDTLITTGNTNTKTNGGWDDTSGDGQKEPLLDVSDVEEFDPGVMPGVNGTDGILGLDALSLEAGVVDIYARSANSTLAHKRFDHGWSGWADLGGDIASTPGVVSRGGTLVDLFALDSNDQIVQTWYHPSVGWAGWGPSYAPQFVGSPDPVSRSDGLIDLYVPAAGNTLRHSWFVDGYGWSGWNTQGGSVTSSTSTISRYTGYIDMVARGTSNDLMHRWYNPNASWSDWVSIGAPTGLQVVGSPTVASRLDGDLDIFVRASDSAIWRKSWVADVGWSSWSSLGGNWSSTPAAVSIQDEEIAIFAIDANGNLHWNRQSSSGWTGWELTR